MTSTWRIPSDDDDRSGNGSSVSDWHRDRLNAAQVAWAEARLRGPELVSDMSWNLIESIVLRVRTSDGEVVVKGATQVTITSTARSLRTRRTRSR